MPRLPTAKAPLLLAWISLRMWHSIYVLPIPSLNHQHRKYENIDKCNILP